MGFLLDTCVVIWYFNGSEKLPTAVVAKLRDPLNDVFVSDASIFEMVIKYSLGKLPLAKPPSRWMDPLIGRHGLTKLPVDTAAIYGLEKLPLLHRDPFDRLLVSQAQCKNLVLVTNDQKIRQYKVKVTWD